jgi:hypothetical protein
MKSNNKKICNICREEKHINNFYLVKPGKSWRKRSCNKCIQQRRADVLNGSLKKHNPNKIVIPKDVEAYKKDELEKWKKSFNFN